MVDLIQLPYRHYGTATSMDLKLGIMTRIYPNTDNHYGRIIQLHPFITGQIKKYKLIESYGDRIYERIFLLSKDISPDDIWWRGDEHLLYPIMCKTITGSNCVVGYSFKYTQGILHYLNDYQNNGEVHIPVYEYLAPDDPRASLVIPHPEEQAISCNTEGLRTFSGPYDPWLNNDVNIGELYPNLRYADASSNGIISLAQSDEIMQGAICIDNDPLEHDWLTWDLISLLNTIAVTDVKISITAASMDLELSSRYNLVYQRDMQYEMLIHRLRQLVCDMIANRFLNLAWTRVDVRKLWSEEVFIDIYESSNPNVISQVLYFDLPIFSLGTLGISSSISSYTQPN